MKKALTIAFVIGMMFLIGCGKDSSTNPAVTSTAEAASAPEPAPVTTNDTFVKSISVVVRKATATDGVAMVPCLSSEVTVSSGCECTGATQSTAGVLFACIKYIDSNGVDGAVAGCYPTSSTSTITPVSVYAVCMSAPTANAVVSVTKPGMEGSSIEEIEAKYKQMIENHKADMAK